MSAVESEAVDLRLLTCPRDGTILEAGIHKVEDGRYECPKCTTRWNPHQLLP